MATAVFKTMPDIYAELIRRGAKTLEDVPEKIRKQVEALLADVERGN